MASPAAVRVHLQRLKAELARQNPTDLSGSGAAEMVQLGVEMERVGVATRTHYARRVADTKTHEKIGHKDAASWLAGVSGESTSAAKGVLELGEKLAQAPLVDQAFSDGRLSLAQAKVVAGAGALDPTAQQELIDKAQKDSFRELKDEVQRVKRKTQGEAAELARERRAHEGRFLQVTPTAHGGVRLSGRLTRLDGARVLSALDAEKDQVFKEARKAGRRTADAAYRADALVRVLCGEAAERPPAAVRLRADLAAVERGAIEGDERCEIDGVGQIPVAEARDLLGHSRLELVLRHGTDIKTVASRKRTIPKALRTAVWERDDGRCVVPGCPNTRYLQIDHDWEFAQGGPTCLDNLQLLCTWHHKQKTLYGFRLVRGPDGERRWSGP